MRLFAELAKRDEKSLLQKVPGAFIVTASANQQIPQAARVPGYQLLFRIGVTVQNALHDTRSNRTFFRESLILPV